MKKQITIVGGGLAGSLLSVYLAKRGFKVDVYERRPDMRKVKISAGRSINLALSVRGIHALKEVGVFDEISKILIPMRGRMVHPLDGEINFQPYSRNPEEYINSVSRGDLNTIMMSAAEEFPDVQYHFNHRCTGMDLETGEARFIDEQTGQVVVAQTQAVIGTDGSASALRSELLKRSGFNYSQVYEDYGYKELSIPSGPEGNFLIEQHALHIWPRKTYMLIALPNMDGSFTVTLFFPMKGDVSFENLDTSEKVQQFFTAQFPDALDLMPGLLDDYFGNPVGSLMTVKCSPWHHKGRVLLLGDAAHAIVPFFGQGMNCAFEDCSVFAGLVDKSGDDWEKIFAECGQERKENTDAIADLAVENFFEMRDHVSDPRYLLMKKIERRLADAFPMRFIPKYEMVSFHRVPYAVAMERGQIQHQILWELTEGIASADEVDWAKAQRLVPERVPPWT